MGRVEAFGLDGLFLWFNSNDHREPHFHAKRPGEYEVRVFLNETTKDSLAYETKFGRKPAGRAQRELAGLVVKHRAALLTEWERKVLLRDER